MKDVAHLLVGIMRVREADGRLHTRAHAHTRQRARGFGIALSRPRLWTRSQKARFLLRSGACLHERLGRDDGLRQREHRLVLKRLPKPAAKRFKRVRMQRMRAESRRAGGPSEIIQSVWTHRSSEIEAATRRRSLIGSAFIAGETAEPPASAGALAMAAWSPCACERMRRSWARRGGGMPASYSANPAIRRRDPPLHRPT